MLEFDYLVLGGGSAGSVVASRLSERPDVTVALVEAGNKGAGWVVNTPIAGALMVPSRLNNWAFKTVPQKGLNGRIGYQPRGRALGGSSAVNAMVYVRGHRWDYDHWAELGCKGWAFDDVLPYFLKAETNERGASQWHGADGPLHVSNSRTGNPWHAIFLEAAREAQFRMNEDFNGPEQEGFGVYQVTQKNGERWSAARGYLHPFLGKRANLCVETGAQVTRILFEGRRAIGAEFRQGGVIRHLRARREVILCAGALQSPHVLMLSGVGDAPALQKMGIAPVLNLPAVGKNLQDHPDFIFGYEAKSLDLVGLSMKGFARFFNEIRRYRRERQGMLASNFAEAGGFLKTRSDLPAPDIQVHFVVAMVDDHARRLRWGHGFSAHLCLLRPKSRGSVALAAPDPFTAPLIDPNFLDHPDDVEDMVAGFKQTRRIMDAPALASLRGRDLFTANIRTDEEIRSVLRERVDTVYHPAGTCRMGTGTDAVVTPDLKVVGMEGLRVADVSIMPTLISGNTNAPAVMIGEKAADLIARTARSADHAPVLMASSKRETT
ncbi:MAG TPA: GMC family oxidoreductase N-terminal domain-containing protein [Beijerinckiaceae bacterium]|nr:GMC family oxidoreductase N-terminal domain-containing protein [Beijerinckiaceae bacterium]